MNIFDVIGPVMIGPSSSHTAGALKIGNVARKLLGEKPETALITLTGSFASTGKGHGTDRALVAGLLGMKTDDERIHDSFNIAKEEALNFTFEIKDIKNVHPNTVIIDLKGITGKTVNIIGESIGGGKINISGIDGVKIRFNGEYNTLIVHNIDKPGHVANVSKELFKNNVNIANMQLFRNDEGGYAVMMIECDQVLDPSIGEDILKYDGIIKVNIFNREEE